MYENILVGTDGSGAADRAVAHALELAERYGATVHGIFVVDTGIYGESALSSADIQTHEIEATGAEFLDEIERRAAEIGVTFERRCCHGRPHEEIIGYANTIDADLVVLGHHGRTHADGTVLGSVSDRVIRFADRPTLIIS